MVRRLVALLLAAASSAAAADDMTWRRRSLRAPSPSGYLAVVTLAPAAGGPSRAVLACEGVELRAAEGRWNVMADGRAAGQGALPGDGPPGFLVKRTATSLLLGLNGRWVYSRKVGPPQGKPTVRVGVSPGWRVTRSRLVARQAVRFADDFPDPEPQTGLWAPVRGRWALSSLSFASQSANPAQLAALFDELEDEASRDRTRYRVVGIGTRVSGVPAMVWQVASGSPANRAGIREKDLIRKINGEAVRSGTQANELFGGKEGEKLTVTVERDGEQRKVELTREAVEWGKARRVVPLAPHKPDRQALITTGYDFWTDFAFACAVQTHGVGAFGLVFAYLGPGDYHVFRWLGADAVPTGFGCWQLVRVRGGRETVLAERQGGFLPNAFYAMSVAVEGDATGHVRARGAVDGTVVLEAADDAMVPGKIGFWAQAPGTVCFDDVVVGDEPPRRAATQGSASRYQRYDRIMRAWADPAYAWKRAGSDGLWVHTGEFPGDVAVAAPVVGGQPTALVIAAQREAEDSGYAALLAEDGKSIQLKRAGKTVAQKQLARATAKELALSREGRQVRVAGDGEPLLHYEDPQPLLGTTVRARVASVKDIRVACPNVLEDYFNSAPTEWHVLSGRWDVMNRWVCDPKWSFFGGRDDELLAIWSKRRLEGDCFLDVFLGIMMLSRMPRYENLRDVGLTICGDGANVASGYAAIVGADRNRVTVLYRQGKLVAHTASRDALLPTTTFRGRRGEGDSQHRGWRHVKLARQGAHVRLYLRDRLVLDYEDPEPLPGGHAAVWSVESGLLLAKARLAATQLGERKLFLRGWRPFADGALTNDCEGGRVRIEADGGTYAVTNATGGGTYAVALRPRVFSALERPRLSFDLKLGPDAKIDLYFRCRGELFRVLISGPSDDSSPAETLGVFRGVQPDGCWHRVSFDLLAALRAKFPDDKLLMVWQPELANYANRRYLLAGFGGNQARTTYWLRGLTLGR